MGSGFVKCFEVDAKVLERVECLPLVLQHSQVFAVTVVPKRSQVSEVVSEFEARYSSVTVVESLKSAVANFVVVWAVEELIEPMVCDVVPDFALVPRNSWAAVHVLENVGPMLVETEPGQVLVPMDLNWLQGVLEVVLGLLGSKEAEVELEFVMKAMH